MGILLAAVATASLGQAAPTFTAQPRGLERASFQENTKAWNVKANGSGPGWAAFAQQSDLATMTVENSTSAGNYFRDSLVMRMAKFSLRYRVWTSIAPTGVDGIKFRVRASTREYTEAKIAQERGTGGDASTYSARAYVDSPTLSADLRISEIMKRRGFGTSFGNGAKPGYVLLGAFDYPFETIRWTKSGGRWFTDVVYDVPWLYTEVEAHAGNRPNPTIIASARATCGVMWEILGISRLKPAQP